MTIGTPPRGGYRIVNWAFGLLVAVVFLVAGEVAWRLLWP